MMLELEAMAAVALGLEWTRPVAAVKIGSSVRKKLAWQSGRCGGARCCSGEYQGKQCTGGGAAKSLSAARRYGRN
jgi:hypothetical protein